jgi:hypothetical protein
MSPVMRSSSTALMLGGVAQLGGHEAEEVAGAD